jgi:hypothetical protein
MAEWRNITFASALNGAPSTRIAAPVIGKLDLLPFDALFSWEDFERLQWRVMRDVEGLRYAQLYGERGQAQFGLDIVALAPDGTGVALQSKKYKRFGAADLKSAVKKFRTTKRPFDVQRLIIGVSLLARGTGVVEALAALRKEIHPIELDLWDARELSERLRSRPEIVVEFFGMPTAEAFCLPFKVDVTAIPTADAVAVREAIARTPEVVTGAQLLFDKAASEGNPSEALALIEAGQAKLLNAGFGTYAAQHDDDRIRRLANLNRTEEAAGYILQDFWAALDQGLSATAGRTRMRIEEIAKAADGQRHVELCRRVISAATSLYQNPLGSLPDVDNLRVGAQIDQVRLVLLAGETALANDDHEWLSGAASDFAELANVPAIDRVLRTRLRILNAEATGDWSGLLSDARRLKLGHDLLGLVTARYARNCAINQRFEEADLSWDEASGSASLAQQWGEASTWIFSRRAFRSCWKPFTSDDLLPLQTAIRGMGTSTPLVPADTGAYEDAVADLNEEKLRSAAISAQRALRDAVTVGDWGEEDRARRVLARVLAEASEPALAARHLTRAGATKAIEALGRSTPLQFINIVDDLDASNYWTVGTSYRLLATQADLIPDWLVSQIAEHIVAELAAAEAGIHPDLRSFATSRYNNAIKALAGIADRLDTAHAEAVLTHFENQSPVEENHYRYHDEDEAVAVGKIALSQPSLAGRAVPHLVTLLGRSQAAQNEKTHEAIHQNRELAHDTLDDLARAGNQWAAETLAFEEPEDVGPEVAEQALTRLTTPLKHATGVFTLGTGAVGDSLLIRHLPVPSVHAAVSELLSRSEDPHVGSSDRGDYLIAAANLAPHLDETSREVFFPTALRLATSPAPSKSDDLDAQFTHKLGGFRMTGTPRDSRGQAAFLASVLATNETQRSEARRLVYALLGEESDYWPTRALQRLGKAVRDDLAFLGSQGWAIRCFAASLWAEHGEPSHLGNRLAADRDVRVRRELARALSRQPETLHVALREQLAVDPAYSVRLALATPSDMPQVPGDA